MCEAKRHLTRCSTGRSSRLRLLPRAGNPQRQARGTGVAGTGDRKITMDEQVILPDLKVMYVESPTGTAGAAAAFDQLESRLPSLKRRKFYGTFQRPLGPYRACTAIEAGENSAMMGLSTGVIPGGKYKRRKARGLAGQDRKDWRGL